MSTQIEINGKTLLPIKEAAKLVSYTKDYVARLAREQKIVASQVGRQWFVDLVSLKNFAEVSQLELSVRKQILSQERKKEQSVKQALSEVHQSTHNKFRRVKIQAQLAAVFVLGFGLLAGASIYTTSLFFPIQSSSLARIGATSPEMFLNKNYHSQEIATPTGVVNEVNDYKIAEPQTTTLYNSVLEYPLFTDEAETRAMSLGNSEGIFLLARNGEVRSVEEVEGLFSDEVVVSFSDESNGVITFTKEEGEVVEFPFVSVPVKETDNKGFSDQTE